MHDYDTCIDLTCPHCLAGTLGAASSNSIAMMAPPSASAMATAARKATRKKKFVPSTRKRTSGSTVSAMRRKARRGGGGLMKQVLASRKRGGRRRGGSGIRGKMRKMRFSRIRRRLARKLGLSIKKTQSGYSYPQIPQQVEQGIPNYYADSRKDRMLEPIPAEEATFARKIGRFIFEQLPDDPDRGNTVEETIANVLDFAANRALAADDQESADQLIKIGKKWRKAIGKKQAAIDPDAPLDEANEEANDEEMGFIGITAAALIPKTHKKLAIASIGASIVGLSVYNKGPKKGRDKRALLSLIGTALAATVLLNVFEKD